MFEQSLQTEEWKVARDREGRSEDEIKARRLAAILLAVNAFVTLFVTLLVTGGPPPPLGVIVAYALAAYLYKLRPRAENLALGLAILYSVLFLARAFWKLPFFEALVQPVGNSGISGALLLLLTGVPSAIRRVIALAVFAVFGCGYYLLALLGHFLEGGGT